MNSPLAYGPSVRIDGTRSRFIDNGNGLTMHVLEAGYEQPGRPCVLLLHGFPELAYSWRKVIPQLAAAGYHVLAPDQRGYGPTTGWDPDYDGDLLSYRMTNLALDTLGLLAALGIKSVVAVVGHDFGSPVAAYCSLIRPDVFRSMVLMSAPFSGPPKLPFNTVDQPQQASAPDVHSALAALERPRKHYQWYYSGRAANANMHHAAQGLPAFIRAYYHYKSADWKQNQPYKLSAWTAEELAKLPTYYVMDLDRGMAETVAPEMPTPTEVAQCRWLTEAELAVYASEYARTGFQGGLQWYRCRTIARIEAELRIFSGRTIDVPSCFIAGRNDWGVRQIPGALEAMEHSACSDWQGTHLIPDAGHWVQQEQPDAVNALLLDFLNR